MGATDRTLEGADTTTAHQVRSHQAICHCSWQGLSSFQVPPSSFSEAIRGKGQGWYLRWTADQEDHRMWRVHQAAEQEAENGLEQFRCVVHSFLGNQKAENYVQLFQALIKNYAKMGCRISLEVQILDTHLEKFKKNMTASIKIYWTLKMLIKDSITKTWWGTTFGALFEKAICSTLATLENYSFLNLFEWFLTLFVYLPYKCCFLSHRMNKNVKLSSFFHNRYEIFLGWVHKIKVCAECSRFSIGFRHKQLKRNTWKPGTNIVLHCVTDDLNFSSDDSD